MDGPPDRVSPLSTRGRPGGFTVAGAASGLPGHRVADAQRAVVEDLAVGAGAPVGLERGAQPRVRLVHARAGAGLAEQADAHRADAHDAAGALPVVETARQEVGAAGGGVDLGAELALGLAPAPGV